MVEVVGMLVVDESEGVFMGFMVGVWIFCYCWWCWLVEVWVIV